MASKSNQTISSATCYLAIWSEINTRMQMRDRAIWNYVAGSAVLLGVSLADGSKNAWLGLFVPWIGLVSVVLFAFHDRYIAFETRFLAELIFEDDENEHDWFKSRLSSDVFQNQHWLLAAQFVALSVPSMVALALAGRHFELPFDTLSRLGYALAYGASLIVALVAAVIAIWSWHTHSMTISHLSQE